MNTFADALSKAGVNAEDFKENERIKFSMFPFITRWRDKLPDKADYLDSTYKYKQERKSKPLQEWAQKQNPGLIHFLKKNKDRIYLFSEDECRKYLECWLGYNAKYQKFVIRINPFAQTLCPWSMPVNSYAANFVKAVYDVLNMSDWDPVYEIDKLDFVSIINIIPDQAVPAIIRKTFSQGIIPIENFDPILDINTLVAKSMITAQSTNLDDIRKDLAELEEKEHVLSQTKVHKSIIDLYCGFNNIRTIDPFNMTERTMWLNLVFAKDTKAKKKKDKNKSFFIVM